MRSHILNRHQPEDSRREAERFVLPLSPCLGNGQRPVVGAEWYGEHAGLSFPPCFHGLLIFRPHSYVGRKQRENSENEVDPEGGRRRRIETPGDRGRSADGPRGALGFHYAKPQMESCDRVSLRGRPRRRTMAPGIRLLRCNVT